MSNTAVTSRLTAAWNLSSAPLVCYAPTMISMGGVWRGENPLDYSFPLFLLQLLLIILTTRATSILLQPLRQPRYLCEIIGGLLLGPTVMGRIPNFATVVFPLRSVLILETMAHLGLVFFVFMLGVEIDVGVVQRTGQSVAFAGVCVGVPFAIGSLSALIIHPNLSKDVSLLSFIVFLCVTLSITAFSVLARTLAELKLLNTALGATAISSAMLVDSVAWALLALAITLAQNDGDPKCTLWTMLSGVAFYAATVWLTKPAVEWVARRTPEGEEVDDLHACLILVGVLVAGVVADAIGIHAITGAFLYGLVIPHRPLGEALVERLEDFVEGLLLPLFFATSGLKTDFGLLRETGPVVFLVLMVTTTTMAKVGGCLLVAHLYEMALWDGFSIGLLMNAKGIIEIVLLNIGRDRQLLNDEAFAVLVLMSVVLTAVISPLLPIVVKPVRHLAAYQRRTVRWPRSDSELRILACVHTPRNVPTILGIIESANSSHIMHAFESYEQHAAGVSVHPLSAVSPYPTMHEDVCAAAEDHRAALLLLPFHKNVTVDGGMEVTNLGHCQLELGCHADHDGGRGVGEEEDEAPMNTTSLPLEPLNL